MHRTRRALLAGLLVVVAVSLGFALSGVPNIELLSFAVFLSGFLLGAGYGALVGAVSAALFSVLNPLGTGLPPLVAAQALGQIVVGVAGAATGPAIARTPNRAMASVFAGGVGFAVTVLYDALTTAGAYVTFVGEKSIGGLVKFGAGGLVFVGVHIVWNTALFFVALVPTLRVLSRYREELTAG